MYVFVFIHVFIRQFHTLQTSYLWYYLNSSRMDMLNKLKSAVSSALPGIPLAKDFEMLDQTGSAGPGLLWKIHDGITRTTKQVCGLTSDPAFKMYSLVVN